MSFRDCIGRALNAGEISQEQADRARAILDEEEALSVEAGQGAASDGAAARRAMDRLNAEVFEAERRQRLQMARIKAVTERLESYDTPQDGLADLVESHGNTPHGSVEGRRRTIVGQAHSIMTDVLRRFERDPLTRTRNKADLDDVTRELFGESTGNASAREMADAFQETAEFLRQRHNAAGGAVRKLDNWGLPQSHDAVRVRRAGAEAWVSSVLPRLDRARMLDDATGQPLSDARLRALLDDMYEAITTNGWSRRQASQRPQGRSSTALRHDERRILHFKSADDWLAYQDQFGRGDAFAAMTAYVDRMARDTAAMEVLGPNPQATIEYAVQLAERHNNLAGKAETPLGTGWLVRDMYALYSGTSYSASDSQFGRALGTFANFKVASQLGGAALSALTDGAYHAVARRMVGMKATTRMGEILRQFNPADGTSRRAAVRAGLIADGAAALMAGQGRYVNEWTAHEWSSRLADAVLRLSGLSPMTQVRRWAFGMEFMGHMADEAAKPWAALDGAMQRTFERYGLGEADWDVIRASAAYQPRPGARFIRPEEVAAAREDVAQRMHEMILMETDFAVPIATLRARATLGQGTNNPFMQFVARSVGMYKSFPVSVMLLYGARSASEFARGGAVVGARMAASLVVRTTLMGALALQLKEITKGRDPRPMDTTEFWQSSLLQGGGLGIFGDFLFSDLNRFGGGLSDTLTGPLAQTTRDVLEVTFGNLDQAIKGEDTNFGGELARLVNDNLPGSSIWYLRLAYERALFDQIEEMVDPDVYERRMRRERRYRRDFDQEYWWRQGEALPERAPDLANTLGPQ